MRPTAGRVENLRAEMTGQLAPVATGELPKVRLELIGSDAPHRTRTIAPAHRCSAGLARLTGLARDLLTGLPLPRLAGLSRLALAGLSLSGHRLALPRLTGLTSRLQLPGGFTELTGRFRKAPRGLGE